jgi:hypothetical protein
VENTGISLTLDVDYDKLEGKRLIACGVYCALPFPPQALLYMNRSFCRLWLFF